MGKLNKGKLTEEQRKLAEENFGLIDEFFRVNFDFDKEEYWGVAAIALCKACRGAFKNKSSFKTYVFNCIKKGILDEIRIASGQKRGNGDPTLSLDEDIQSGNDSKREERYEKPGISTFDNDPYFSLLVEDILKKSGMTEIEKVVFLNETDLVDYTNNIPALMSGHYSKYRKKMEEKLKKFYFPCEKTA